MMIGRRTNAGLGTSLVLALALGWSAVGAKTPKKTVDWVKVNPAFEGATFVNDPKTCRTCHEDAMKTYAGTVHARAHASGAMGTAGACETCHGPRSEHVESPDASLKLPQNARAESGVCLQCHEGGTRMGWKAGAHQANDVSCTSCHVVMEQRSPTALLNGKSASDTCYACHGDIRLEMNKMSHHPVREGRIECASCHNVHGSNVGLLIKPTQNDTCYTCHTEKRGPYVWEHAPAREDCGTCHTPHGSNNRTLLTQKDPFLCLGCHSYGGHINLPRYNRTSNPYGNGCSNCHMSVHGSNHPSGAKLTR
jgi:DmsE family decaheme c-type cytochrome